MGDKGRKWKAEHADIVSRVMKEHVPSPDAAVKKPFRQTILLELATAGYVFTDSQVESFLRGKKAQALGV